MKKILILLITTTSLIQATEYVDNYTYERSPKHLRANSFKPLHPYLDMLNPVTIIIPSASSKAQEIYIKEFMIYYNTVIYKEAADKYCSLFGRNDAYGFAYGKVTKSIKVDEHVERLIRKFQVDFSMYPETGVKLQYEKMLTIETNGRFSLNSLERMSK